MLASSVLLAALAQSPLSVPAALSARFPTIEPSGLAWAPALGRFLVVSDDLGPSRDHHLPYVLALDPGGAFDPAPLRLHGVDELDDAEAIAAGPGNTFFVLTSHSPNAQGKTKAARRQLLLLELKGGRLYRVGALDLSHAKSKDGRGIGALAADDPFAVVDLEGLAYDGARLLVGLKSPLRSDGAAVVLALAEPEVQLRRGWIAPGAFTVASAWPLRRSDGVAQGISELCLRADGTLFIGATTPKGTAAGAPESGAVWRLDAGAAAPTQLVEFPGLKPEGIAEGPDGGLLIVFDRGGEAPQAAWLGVPR